MEDMLITAVGSGIRERKLIMGVWVVCHFNLDIFSKAQCSLITLHIQD